MVQQLDLRAADDVCRQCLPEHGCKTRVLKRREGLTPGPSNGKPPRDTRIDEAIAQNKITDQRIDIASPDRSLHHGEQSKQPRDLRRPGVASLATKRTQLIEFPARIFNKRIR